MMTQKDLQDIPNVRTRGASLLVMDECHFQSCVECVMVTKALMEREGGWRDLGKLFVP